MGRRRRHRSRRLGQAGIIIAAGVVWTACGAILGADDLVYDIDPNGSSTAGGGTGGGVGGSAGTGGGTGAGGGTGGSIPVAPPLEVVGTVADGAVSVQVEGFFQLDFAETDFWQPGRWYDLATAPALDLSSKPPQSQSQNTRVLFQPFCPRYEGVWHGVDDALDGSALVIDERPARVIFDTTIQYAPAAAGFEVRGIYTIYASGRVGIRSIITNTSSVAQTLGDLEYNYTSVAHTIDWSKDTVPGGLAAFFVRTDGASPYPNLLVVSQGPETPSYGDSPTNVYWDQDGTDLAAGASLERVGELQLGPGGLSTGELAARADDVSNPELVVVQGGSAVGSGFDPALAAYVIDASSDAVDFRLSNAHIRHSPAFVLHSYDSASWTISLDSEVLVTSGALSGPRAHAHYDPDSNTLVFVYLDSVLTGASEAERTFQLRSP